MNPWQYPDLIIKLHPLMHAVSDTLGAFLTLNPEDPQIYAHYARASDAMAPLALWLWAGGQVEQSQNGQCVRALSRIDPRNAMAPALEMHGFSKTTTHTVALHVTLLANHARRTNPSPPIFTTPLGCDTVVSSIVHWGLTETCGYALRNSHSTARETAASLIAATQRTADRLKIFLDAHPPDTLRYVPSREH